MRKSNLTIILSPNTTKHSFSSPGSSAETCLWFRNCPTQSTICCCKTTSTPTGTHSGSSLRCRTRSKTTRSSSTSSTNTSRICYTKWVWKLSFIVRRNHKRKISAGIAVVKISCTLRTATPEALSSTNLITLWPFSILSCTTMMKCILLILIPILTLTCSPI